MATKEEIMEEFSDIMCPVDGICGFVSPNSTDYLFHALENIEKKPITKVQLNQLLNMQHIRSISDGFVRYYWLDKQRQCKKPIHFYQYPQPMEKPSCQSIESLVDFKRGLQRIFTDCLLIYGNINTGFQELASKSYEQLVSIFQNMRIDSEMIKERGATLHFNEIDKENRYLIAEMACKSLGDRSIQKAVLREKLRQAYHKSKKENIKNPTVEDLLSAKYTEDGEKDDIALFTCTDYLEEYIVNEAAIDKILSAIFARYLPAREAAIKNTQLYLSLVNDLDVYVATSMRTKRHFMDMAEFCEAVFNSPALQEYDLRYFDPTMSATNSHEDKGLIECLMVKAARMLIYAAGEGDSYGKDAEAAMALCLGKPVIFYCGNNAKRSDFFRNVHPLSRLVNFDTGVACGVIICEKIEEVATILKRIFSNTMQYNLKQKKDTPGYYVLEEDITGSVVRVQTNDQYLTSAFWNYYL